MLNSLDLTTTELIFEQFVLSAWCYMIDVTGKNNLRNAMATTTTTSTRNVQDVRRETSLPSTQQGIPKSYWNRLDPDWASLWEKHGTKVARADLVTIEEVRQNPSKYSFTYPTYPGT
jgi:hypothetical protein